MGFPRLLFEVLVRFGLGECFGISFSILCALRAYVARQGFALETPSSPDGFVRLADPPMLKRPLGCFVYYPYYSPCSFSRLQFGDILRRHPLQAPTHGDRGGSFEHSLVSRLRSAPATAGTAEHLSRPG